MKVVNILLLSLVCFSVCVEDEEFPLENNVIVLTDATYEKAVAKYDNMMLLLYAPWCGHCKKFHPEYEKAAATLRKENLYLAKVDATVEKELAKKFNVKGFPTVKLLIKGQPIDYTGGRTEKEVVDWMRKKTGPPCRELKTVEDVEKFQKDNEVCVVYLGDDKTVIEEYTKAARKNDEVLFGLVTDKAVAEKFGKVGTVVLFKKFDEKKNELTKDLTEKTIEEFVNTNSLPKVMKIEQKTIQIIFGEKKPGLFLFADEKSEKYKEYEELLKKVHEKVKDKKLVLVLNDIKGGFPQRVAEYVGVKNEDLPTVLITDTRVDLKKYKMTGDVTYDNVVKFVDDWENKKLSPYLKSAEEPKENKDDVLVVVGKTFKRDVIDNDKDVLLLFYAPWCGHCKALHPKYEEAAKKLKANNPKLVLAKIDATENEVESVHITGFPTVKFYPGDKKDKAPLDFNGERTTEGIIKYLKEHVATKLVYEEEKKEEKKEEEKKDDKKTGDL